jgi:hypothetical protein
MKITNSVNKTRGGMFKSRSQSELADSKKRVSDTRKNIGNKMKILLETAETNIKLLEPGSTNMESDKKYIEIGGQFWRFGLNECHQK